MHFNNTLEAVLVRECPHAGHFEFNLRDLMRWLDVTATLAEQPLLAPHINVCQKY